MKNNKENKEPFVSDGKDVEYSRELADQDDLEAVERAKAADRRAKNNK